MFREDLGNIVVKPGEAISVKLTLTKPENVGLGTNFEPPQYLTSRYAEYGFVCTYDRYEDKLATTLFKPLVRLYYDGWTVLSEFIDSINYSKSSIRLLKIVTFRSQVTLRFNRIVIWAGHDININIKLQKTVNITVEAGDVLVFEVVLYFPEE